MADIKYLSNIIIDGNILIGTGEIKKTGTGSFIFRNNIGGNILEITDTGILEANDILADKYEIYSGLSTEFLKADGSVDNSVYQTVVTADGKYLRSDITDTKTAGNLIFNDNVRLRFGNSNDFDLYHDGTTNTMNLFNGEFIIKDSGAARFTFGRTTGDFTATGSVSATSLLIDGTTSMAEFKSTSGGVTVLINSAINSDTNIEFQEVDVRKWLIGNRNVTDNFTFRNISATEVATISQTGDFTATGDITATGYGSFNTIIFANKEEVDINQVGEFGWDTNDTATGTQLGAFNGTGPVGLYLHDGTDIRRVWTTDNFGDTHVANWQTAYGWGDHSSGGYAADSNVVHKTGIETIAGTKTFTDNIRITKNANPIIHFNNGTDDRLFFRAGDDLRWRWDGTNDGTLIHTLNASTKLTQFLRSDVADTKTAGNLIFNDDIHLRFGTGSDMGLFHDSSTTKNYLTLTNGNFIIKDGVGVVDRFTFGRTTGDFTNTGSIISSGTGNNSFVGNVGIGATSPGEKLDVVGNGTFSGTVVVESSTNATSKDTGALVLTAGGLGVELDVYAGGKVTATSFDAGGTSSQFLKANGTIDSTVYGAGDVTKVGTPLNNQVGVWTGDGTVEGTGNFTFDGTTFILNGNVHSTHDVVPNVTNTYDLGTSSLRYDIVWCDSIAAEGGGAFNGDVDIDGKLTSFTYSTLTKTASYTLAIGDISKIIICDMSSAGVSITIPQNSSVAFPIGTVITVIRDNNANNGGTIIAGTGTTITHDLASLNIPTGGKRTLTKIGTNLWCVGY